MWEIKGSHWFKADLHLHTVASKCFTDTNTTAEDWVTKAIEENLDCVAVTDHNTGDGIDAIKAAAADTDLVVFPGVEVTCSDSKVHILALFDVDKGSEDVNSFLSNCGIRPDQRGEQDTKVDKTVSEVIKIIKENKGIAIPAHIDQYNGLGGVDHQSLIKTLDEVDGVHVVHKEFMKQDTSINENLEIVEKFYRESITEDEITGWKKAFFEADNKNKALLTFSDNPSSEGSSKHGIWGIGKRYTWIKMDKKISLEGLRQALMMPQLRIENDFMERTNAPETPNMWLHSIEIKDTKLNEEKSHVVNFNPSMTTIIGGRGTGKSSVLRFLRGIFNKNEELQLYKELYEEQMSFYQVEKANNIERTGVLKETSTIILKFYRHDKPYILSVKNFKSNNGEMVLSEWNEKNNRFDKIDTEEVENLLASFDFDIYSQKQVYEIAKETNALRDKIDKTITEMSELQGQTDNLRREYLTKSRIIKNIEEEIIQKGRLNAELKDLEIRFNQLTDGELQETFSKMKNYTDEFNILQEYVKAVKNNILQFKNVELRDIELDLDSFNKDNQEEIKTISDTYLKKQSVLQKEVDIKIKEMEEIQSELSKELFQSVWYVNYEKNKKDYEELKRKFGQDMIEQLDNVETLNKNIMSLQSKLSDIDRKEQELKTLKQEYKDLKSKFKSNRQEIYESRVAFVEEILKDTNQIRIKINKSRDLKNLEQQIRKIIQKPNSFNSEIAEIIDFCNKGKIEDNIEAFILKIHNVRNNEEDDLITGKFAKVIKELTHEQISNLNLLLPEDDIKVEYKNASNNWESLSHASAGQKTSAILTFLLSYGDKPLILDQPEDDLDNFLIYELIVERMKAIKKSRQIIIVTHNANIPVNGDSELVIAMDSKSRGMEILATGSIENLEIKDIICKIMEGGTDAFKLRAKKYDL